MRDLETVTKLLSSSSSSPNQRQMCGEAAKKVLSMPPGQSSEFAAVAVGRQTETEKEKEEEEKLAEQCRSSFFYKHTKLLKVLMMLSSVKLVANSKNDGLQSVGGGHQRSSLGLKRPALRNIIRPVAMLPECRRPKDHCKPGASLFFSRRLVWPPKMGLLTALFLHYALVHLLPLSILSLKRHFILRHLKPSVQPHGPRTNGCALNEDLYFSTPAERAEFEQLKGLEAWLKFLGISMVSSPEFGVSSMLLLAILPLSYHRMCQIFLSLNQYRSDTLCFMFDPLGERRRIAGELKSIVREMILSQSNHKDNLYYGFENSNTLHDLNLVRSPGLCSVKQHSMATIGGAIHSFECPELASSATREAATIIRWGLLNNQARRLRYLQNLFKIKQLKHVNPYIVTSKWHTTLLYRTDLVLKLVIVPAIIGGAMMVLGAMIYDLYDATRLRLELVECIKWRPQGGTRIVALDHLYLNELESTEQLDAYKAHDGSTLSFLKLALFVESTSYFSLKRAICWSEGVTAGYVLVVEALLSATLQVASTSEKIAWLNQLDQQLHLAANEAAEHAHLARRLGSTQEAEERLLNTLTIAYLNYELFRRQQDEYLMLTDLITECLALVSMMSCLIIYCAGISLGNSSPILVFFFSSPLLLQLNIFFVATCYRMKQIEKIISKVSRILAHCSSGPLQLSYPVELWRRQVREESCRRYASRLFGIHITYETVISLNGYAVALLLVLLKPQRGPLLY